MEREPLLEQLKAIIDGASDAQVWRIASLANASAILAHYIERINWVGFYLVDHRGTSFERLVLGPFQGKSACVTIAKGKGVCGTCWEQKRPIIVHNVHAFVGHIACDKASKSEAAVPILVKDTVVAVLDVDSPEPGRFSNDDVEVLQEVAALLKRLWE